MYSGPMGTTTDLCLCGAGRLILRFREGEEVATRDGRGGREFMTNSLELDDGTDAGIIKSRKIDGLQIYSHRTLVTVFCANEYLPAHCYRYGLVDLLLTDYHTESAQIGLRICLCLLFTLLFLIGCLPMFWAHVLYMEPFLLMGTLLQCSGPLYCTLYCTSTPHSP